MSIGLTAVYRHRLEREEQRIGEPLELAHEMLDASPGLLTKYMLAAPLFGYGEAAPREALQVARIAALRAEDCGPCVRIGVAYARLAGLADETGQAAATGRFDELSSDQKLAACFADAVARDLPEAVELGEAVERCWGRAGRVELALAVATARIHPAMKRGLGLAQSCEVLGDAA